ncbi:MAG: GGDEF domain-containing protein [Pseudomonadota bacterium]
MVKIAKAVPKSLHQHDAELRNDTQRIKQYLEKSRFWRNLVLLIITVAPLISFSLYYAVIKNQADAAFRNQVETITRMIALTLDVERHSRVAASPGQDNERAALMEFLATIQQDFAGIQRITTRVIRNDEQLLVLDTIATDSSGVLVRWQTSDAEREGLQQVQSTGFWHSPTMAYINEAAYQESCAPLRNTTVAEPALVCILFGADAYVEEIRVLGRNSILAMLFSIAASALLIYSVLKNHQQVTRSLHLVEKQRDLFLEHSRTDPLTGALNRRAFDTAYTIAEAHFRRNKLPFALISIDIDHFKKVNDSYGHDIGDQVLRTLVQTLQKVIRPNDLLVRMGGEEFSIICNLSAAEHAFSMAEKLREAASRILVVAHDNQHVVFTVSLGVHIVGVDDDIESALRRADIALYCAKRTGRNKTVIYTPDLEAEFNRLQ